ncbi:hypothetical protein ONA91_26735 [Micromonospora sp. DR5-3]|uniref:hypothetical protein n=1 Tax=unclassified Micromonospora TaxID=2617518 RepID=UPI0011D55846|nr:MULTISPECIES: hypothetical protein [unclassified Micromonospora]MCW3818050.1 hypothetical protein [Micromonospora sp. DR5-3]TYC26349.1 hypothetical protein FXF52_03090 [Micromonospora sp. MP36]
MDNRTDPIEIIARVSEQDGKQRAFEVWCYKAGKEGWAVTVESSSVDEPGDECGVVDVEGLRYRIRHARRIRQRVAIVPAGRHLIAAAVDLSLGRSDEVTWMWEFGHAAWAEPVIEDE